MKIQKQYKDSAHNFAFGFVALILIIVFLMIGNLAKAQKTGYYVVTTIDKKNEIIKTADKQQVLNLIEAQFPGSNVNLDGAIYRTKQPSFEMYAGNEGIYVEERLIVKVRKNGKLKMKRRANTI